MPQREQPDFALCCCYAHSILELILRHISAQSGLPEDAIKTGAITIPACVYQPAHLFQTLPMKVPFAPDLRLIFCLRGTENVRVKDTDMCRTKRRVPRQRHSPRFFFFFFFLMPRRLCWRLPSILRSPAHLPLLLAFIFVTMTRCCIPQALREVIAEVRQIGVGSFATAYALSFPYDVAIFI